MSSITPVSVPSESKASEAEFIRVAREKALAAKSKRKEVRNQKDKDNSVYYEPLLAKLTQFILENWKTKVVSAARRGFEKTNLFAYHNGDRFDGVQLDMDTGSAVAFLINGPRENPNYWSSIGITPVLTRLENEVKPFRVNMFFTGLRNGTVIEVVWSDKVTVDSTADPLIIDDIDSSGVETASPMQLYSAAQKLSANAQSHREDTTSYYGDLLNKLTAYILRDWREKVDKASERAYLKTNLFSYHNGDRFDGDELVQEGGSAVAYLLHGPPDDSGHWEKKGFAPVLQRVKETVAPFYAHMFFTGVKNGTVIEVVWDPDLIAKYEEEDRLAAAQNDHSAEHHSPRKLLKKPARAPAPINAEKEKEPVTDGNPFGVLADDE